ncbi:MAG: arginine--tRNA ligase [Gammaproteobacteria bacterium]|nr:arginine--tRNA ligase [Gammaproteobacteria bacterium]
MKETIESLLDHALDQLIADGMIETKPGLQVTRTKDAAHGDFTCNTAMMLAKQAGRAPREIAQSIIDALPDDASVEKVEIAGPGFINFFITQENTLSIINDIISGGERFGKSNAAEGEKVQIEFVSANPTGPLHVGHGRGAAYGATLATLMRAVGFDVDCEYYVNDAGRQMNILAASVWLRYLEVNEVTLTFPVNGYKGEYIYDIANSIKAQHGDAFVFPADEVFKDIHADETDGGGSNGGDKEKHIDDLITRAKHLLGTKNYQQVFKAGLDSILDDIRQDLEEFGVPYDNWYSEQTLADRGLIDKAVEQLQMAGHIEERNGALWFISTKFGDEKDRVVIRDNGQATYFASDIAYHMDKFARGYQRVINIWGADHHGYVARVKAAIGALGEKEDKLDILLVQFANLYRGGERVQMSTRSGSFVTLRELREEVGTDAARFFYVMRKCEQHMDFDLDLAKSQSNDNPVYYIQYAHARICSVIGQLSEKQLKHDIENGSQNLNLLTERHETDIISKLDAYADIVHKSAFNAEPHLLVHYLRELATLLHSYYNAHQFINDDSNLHDARFNLIIATRQILHNGLTLLGVSAPEKM